MESPRTGTVSRAVLFLALALSLLGLILLLVLANRQRTADAPRRASVASEESRSATGAEDLLAWSGAHPGAPAAAEPGALAESERGSRMAVKSPAPEPRSAPASPAQPPPAHVVQGRVRVRSGTWRELDRLLAGHLRLELWSAPQSPSGAPAAAEALGPRRTQTAAAPFTARLEQGEDGSGETFIAFSFPPVPAGAATLTVSSTDALRVVPSPLELTVPCSPLELWILDDVDTLAIGFRVLDAETLEPITDYTAWSVRTEISPEAGVLFHAGPLALDDVPLDATLEWRLWADGFVPASGDERAFADRENGRWVAEVHLRRGWGRRFVVLGRTPAMQPIRGGEVTLDGRDVGRTDADGILDVELQTAPAAYRVTYGELVAAGPVPSDAGADRRARISVIVLEPPSGD